MDDSGWTPYHHALYNGHLAVAESIRCSPALAAGQALTSMSNDLQLVSPLQTFNSDDLDSIPSLSLPPPILPSKVFGHKCLDKHAQVHIRLGWADHPPVILLYDRWLIACLYCRALITHLCWPLQSNDRQTSALKVEMRTRNEGDILRTLTLSSSERDPSVIFSVESLEDFAIRIDLKPTFGSQVIGRSAVTSATFQAVEARGAVSCPIFDSYLEVIGEIFVEFFIVTPYVTRVPATNASLTYWKSTTVPSIFAMGLSSTHMERTQ